MNDGQFIFPGIFSPPTYGHFAIVREVSRIVSCLTIICSTNEEKDKTRWFSEDECVRMWSAYDLPSNIDVITFSDAVDKFDFNNVVMVRGIRCEDDMEHERHVMEINKKQFGIDKIFYLWAKDRFVNVSATRARRAVANLDFQKISKYVAPGVVSVLLERKLKSKNIFMVVGRPGAGKSTFLRMLESVCEDIVWVDTDIISTQTKCKLYEHFGDKVDLIKVMSEMEDEAVNVIANTWFSLLADFLHQIPSDKQIFIEIPYGLKHGKDMYKYLGGKIVHIECDCRHNLSRINKRGTPHHAKFIEQIPDKKQAKEICHKNKLRLWTVNTDCDINELHKRAIDFCTEL
jgi:phosphopantetheine adenylyltransferase/dephospho-CoA kinase